MFSILFCQRSASEMCTKHIIVFVFAFECEMRHEMKLNEFKNTESSHSECWRALRRQHTRYVPSNVASLCRALGDIASYTGDDAIGACNDDTNFKTSTCKLFTCVVCAHRKLEIFILLFILQRVFRFCFLAFVSSSPRDITLRSISLCTFDCVNCMNAPPRTIGAHCTLRLTVIIMQNVPSCASVLFQILIKITEREHARSRAP